MTGKIVQLDDYRPHLAGMAWCIACGHEWAAVTLAPRNGQSMDVWLECPKCNRHRGQYKMPFVTKEPVWECNCGNHLFTVHGAGCFCPNCGVWHDFPDPHHNDTPDGAA